MSDNMLLYIYKRKVENNNESRGVGKNKMEVLVEGDLLGCFLRVNITELDKNQLNISRDCGKRLNRELTIKQFPTVSMIACPESHLRV